MSGLLLPPQPYFPGRTPRPDEALFAPLKEGAEAGVTSPAFTGGLGAFEARYYWEAHELWEAVWMALPPASAEKLWLQGVIQLANAGLKARMGRMAAARRCLALADTALTEAARRGFARDVDGLRAQAQGEIDAV